MPSSQGLNRSRISSNDQYLPFSHHQYGVQFFDSSGFVYLGILLGVNYYSYQTLGLLLGYPYLGLVLAALLGFAFQLFYSLASGTSLLYGAKDILLVGSLAVRHTELGASRLLIAYLLQAPLYWFVTLPSLIVGLWIDGFSLVYLFGGLLFLLVGPLFALSLSVLFSMVLVRLTKGKNHKMAEELVSAVSLVLLILVLTVSLTRNLTMTVRCSHSIMR